jgi:ParB/RepB/Spo0J family partition protein
MNDISISTGVKRNSFMLCDPRLLHVNEDGRPFKQSNYDDELYKLASDMYTHGQLQPVVVRKDGDNYVIVAGNRRTQAAQLIVSGKHPEIHDPGFQIQFITKRLNDEEAFSRNVAENRIRLDVSPIDTALNIRKAQEFYGWDAERTASTFGISVSQVATLQKLLDLNGKQRQMVADGRLTVSAALDLVKLPAGERTKAIAAVVKPAADGTETKSKVNSAELRQQVREMGGKVDASKVHGKSNDKTTAKIADKVHALKIARPWKEVKQCIRDQEPNSTTLQNLKAAIIAFADGTIDDTQLAKAWTAADNAMAKG